MSEKKPKLTPRQALYIKGIVKGKSKKQAALDAGYARTTAEHATTKVETEVCKSAIILAFEHAGITPDAVAQVCLGAMRSTKVVWVGKKPKIVKDHKMRLDGAELAGRFRGDFKERHEITGAYGKPIETKTEIIIGGVIEKL